MSASFFSSACGLTVDYTPGADASRVVDAATGDAGAIADAGSMLDAGAIVDAGALLDAPPILDAGPPDAGCFDLDGDGVRDCDGDCDDRDPTVYPGAPLICGDGRTNDCSDTLPDSECAGLGTYVAPPPLGNDLSPGTQRQPVATITVGLAHATTIGMGVDVYVAAGRYPERVTMIEGVSLLGGYESAAWTRDPTANVSAIAPPIPEGVIVPTGITRATELSGSRSKACRG